MITNVARIISASVPHNSLEDWIEIYAFLSRCKYI
nr:MAG TPA: Transcription initiation factor TFIID subunit, Complex, TFIID, TAF, TBD-associated [Caudoviricetes sp.]